MSGSWDGEGGFGVPPDDGFDPPPIGALFLASSEAFLSFSIISESNLLSLVLPSMTSLLEFDLFFSRLLICCNNPWVFLNSSLCLIFKEFIFSFALAMSLYCLSIAWSIFV